MNCSPKKRSLDPHARFAEGAHLTRLQRKDLANRDRNIFSGSLPAIGSNRTNPIKNVKAVNEFTKNCVLHVKCWCAAYIRVSFTRLG